MASLNRADIIGNLGDDPDLRTTPAGRSVATMSIATNRRWTTTDDKGKEERHEEVSWHRVVVWGRQAEQAAKSLRKGDPVYIEGRMHTRKYTDKDGIDRWTTEVIARMVQFLKPAPAGARAPHPASGASEPTGTRRTVSRPSSGGDTPPDDWPPDYIPSDPGNDDIPF